MILAIDIGGTKTELASLSPRGRITGTLRFPTSQDEDQFFATLTVQINKNFPVQRIAAISIAIPGPVRSGKPLFLGNLPWRRHDLVPRLKKLFRVPVYLENDARLAALYETRHCRSRALYITLSTGIGVGVTTNGKLTPEFSTYEPGHDKYDGVEWEDIAAASAVIKAYRKKSVFDITDQAALEDIAERISIGLISVIDTVKPKTIVFGGPLGRMLPRYRTHLITSLRTKNTTPIPALKVARSPHSVIHGCYLHAKNSTK